MANTYLTRTPSGTGSTSKSTISVWFKRSNLSSYQDIWESYNDGSNYFRFRFRDDNRLDMQSDISNSTVFLKRTTRVFRDTSAWYHICVTIDLTQSNADKIKLYINGTRETAFDSSTDLTSTSQQFVGGGGGYNFTIGRHPSSDAYFNGSMSHINFIDGTAYDASAFGETDATTGEWKIKTSPSVTYGTNGFFILKDGNSVTDQSGNSNNFTVGGGTLTKTEDCPSNVFATWNPLLKTPSALSYLNGNTTVKTTNSQWEGSISTIAPSSGKWYWEARYNTGTGIKLDIVRQPTDLRFFDNSNQSYGSYNSNGYGYQLNNSGTDYYCSNNTCTTWSSSRGNSTKIYMVAVDLDNGKYWIGANGTWFNTSGTANPTTGDDPRHSFSAKLNGDAWFMCMSCEGNGNGHNANFGNGYFGTTAVTSNSGNGYSGTGNLGIFQYQPPTNYTALSTKGLNL